MDYYDQILTIYEKSQCFQDSLDLSINTFIINLMNNFSKLNDKMLVSNCLIILLNLFYVNAPDIYHSRGKVLSDLAQDELEQVCCYIKLTLNELV